MPISLAFTGGKGGTGKTFMAINFAAYVTGVLHRRALLVDCDVENPNCRILLGKDADPSIPVETREIAIYMPNFDPAKCTYCGKCRDACYRHAILQFASHSPS